MTEQEFIQKLREKHKLTEESISMRVDSCHRSVSHFSNPEEKIEEAFDLYYKYFEKDTKESTKKNAEESTKAFLGFIICFCIVIFFLRSIVQPDFQSNVKQCAESGDVPVRQFRFYIKLPICIFTVSGDNN